MNAEKKLEELQKRIQVQEHLAEEVCERVRERISEARKDAAGFERDITGDIFTVKHAFRSEWITHIPDFQKIGGYHFIVHPFAEDLMIEPRNLFSYTLPVFTELNLKEIILARNVLRVTKNISLRSGGKFAALCLGLSDLHRTQDAGRRQSLMIFTRLQAQRTKTPIACLLYSLMRSSLTAAGTLCLRDFQA